MGTTKTYDFAEKFGELCANPTPQKLSGFVRACRNNPGEGRQALRNWYYGEYTSETEEQKFKRDFPALYGFMEGAEL